MAQEPDEGMRMRGSTGTDAAQHYVDDGLQQSLDGLHRAQLALQKDVADMAALIGPARSETRYLKCKKPRFPISTYKAINRWVHVFLTGVLSQQFLTEQMPFSPRARPSNGVCMCCFLRC